MPTPTAPGALPPPLPWPADLSCHPCVRGEHEKCPGFAVVEGKRRACAHGGPTCEDAQLALGASPPA